MHTLYLYFTLCSSFSVDPVTSVDLPGIVKLCGDLDKGSDVMEDIQRYLQAKRDPLAEGATPISALVAKCSNQIVGVAVLRDEEVSHSIRWNLLIKDQTLHPL